MGGCRCSFRTCENSSATRPGGHFFHFPVRDEERCSKWADFANKKHFMKLPTNVLRNKVVCSDHFTIDCFMNIKKERLTKLAIPTLLPLPTGDILDFASSSDVDGNNSSDENNITANITVSSTKNDGRNEFLETEVFYLEHDKADMEYESVDFIDDADDSEEMELKSKKVHDSDYVKVLNGKQKLSTKHNAIPKNIGGNNGKNISVSPVKRKASDNIKEIKLKKIPNPMKKLRLSLPGKPENNKRTSTEIEKDCQIDLSNEKIHFVDDHVPKASVSEKETNLKEKLLECVMKDVELHKQKVRDEISELKNSSEKTDELLSIQNTLNEEVHAIGIEIGKFKEKCFKQLDRIEKYQKLPVTVNNEHSSVSVASPKLETNTTGNMSKAQLFNGIKKYLNPSMVSLLRMEMFSCPERKYKVDEKNFAMELFELKAESAYEYMRDEWRFRLPPKKDIEQWIKERDDAGNGELEWDDC